MRSKHYDNYNISHVQTHMYYTKFDAWLDNAATLLEPLLPPPTPNSGLDSKERMISVGSRRT
jgi:hypothetical protein